MNKAQQTHNLFNSLPRKAFDYILQDLPRWSHNTRKQESEAFQKLWDSRQEFRSLIRYRIGICQQKFDCPLNVIAEVEKIAGNASWLYVTNMFISCSDIGPGLYIEHGFSSIIYAIKIGKNFWFNQNVTVGSGKHGNPTIGDDVRLGANSVVIGGFHVTNNVQVGAGAVLNFEVPEGSTVVAQKPRVLPPKK